MFSRTLARSYELGVSAERAWAHLSDPVALAAESSHPVRIEKPDPGVAVGTSWLAHHGPECDFDVVRWTVVELDPGRRLTVEGFQAGARQRATTILEPSADGVEVQSVLELRPALRAPGTVLERVLIFVMLATGLGGSLIAEQFDQSVADEVAHFDLAAPAGDVDPRG